MTLTIKELQRLSHITSNEKGFYDQSVKNQTHLFFIVTRMALIISEISECIEGIRCNGITDNTSEELADAIIRICDLAEYMNLDLEKAINSKMSVNNIRPVKHNKKF